jgi:hypothetical protein
MKTRFTGPAAAGTTGFTGADGLERQAPQMTEMKKLLSRLDLDLNVLLALRAMASGCDADDAAFLASHGADLAESLRQVRRGEVRPLKFVRKPGAWWHADLWRTRYLYCRFWHQGRAHAALSAVFHPRHYENVKWPVMRR